MAKYIIPSKRNTRTKDDYRIYQMFADMHHRCYDPKNNRYYCYGGRGITICNEWARANFNEFLTWAKQNGWQYGLQIDRVDPDKPYSPDNCRFVTVVNQQRNTRRNRVIEAFGETKTLSMWGEDPRCAVKCPTLRRRLVTGWHPEAAIVTPATCLGRQ